MPKSALAVVIVLAATPALATGDIFCVAPDGSARVDLGVGHVPVLAILSVRIEAGGRVWSSRAEANETPVAVGQGFRDRGQMAVDFTDPNVEGVLAELRTWSVAEGSDFVETGWLRLPGIGAFGLTCEAN